MLGLELSPVAGRRPGDGLGALTDARVLGAYVSRYITLGVGVGGQVQKNSGYRGLSLASHVRLGSVDGLNLELTYSHSLSAQPVHGQADARLCERARQAPGAARAGGRPSADLGLSLDAWAYATLGVRYRLFGNGGRAAST
jgi:hypothetical protein